MKILDEMVADIPLAAEADWVAITAKESDLDTVVYMVRHCQSSPSTTVAECDWPLSEVGNAQAKALVSLLSSLKIEHVFSSPFLRCVSTIAPFALAHKIEVFKEPRLRERKIAPPNVLDFSDVWPRSWADFSYALEGCEDSWTCQKRMVQAVGEIVERHRGRTLAICSHGSAIGLFMNHVRSNFGIEEASKIRTPEVVRVVWNGASFHHDQTFSLGPAFDSIATDFRATPGVKA